MSCCKIQGNFCSTKTTFVFDATWWQMMECLPDEEKLDMVNNIVKFATTGVKPELEGYPMIFFNMVSDSIERSQSHYEDRVRRSTRGGVRMARKVQNMRCKACANSAGCRISAAVCVSGSACDRLSISKAAEMVIDNCQKCETFGSCRHKFARVVTEKYSPCAGFTSAVNSVNDVNDATVNNMNSDNGSNDDIDNSYSTALHKNIKSSTPPVAVSREGGGDVKAFEYDKEKIIAMLVKQGADRDWAMEKYGELEAMGFRSGGKLISNLVSYMRACWQARCKKVAAADKAAEAAMRRGSEDVEACVPEDMKVRFDRVRERTLADERDVEGFTGDFHLVNVIGNAVYVRVPSKTTLDLYCRKYGGDGFFERLKDEFGEYVIKLVYES